MMTASARRHALQMAQALVLALACAAAVLGAAPGAAQAAPVTHRVSSVISGQIVYEIVLNTDAGEPESGIYGPAADGSTALLVAGRVMGLSPFFNGIVEQMPLSRLTSRNEAVAVVDGQIVFFSSLTRPDRPESRIVLGSAENPIFDAAGNRLRLDRIADVNSVRLIASEVTASGHAFLISIRQANSFGDGLTIAGFLRLPLGPETPDRLAFERPPTIVDYAFLEPTQMRYVLPDGPNGGTEVHSRAHLLALAQPTNRDNRLITAWRQMLRQRANQLRAEPDAAAQSAGQAASEGASQNSTVWHAQPVLNIQTGAYTLQSLPMERILRDPFSVVQRIDPFTGASTILASHIVPANLADMAASQLLQAMPGIVDYDAERGAYRAYSYRPSRGRVNGTASAIVFVDNQAHLLFFNGGATAVHAVPLGDFLSNDFEAMNFTLSELVRTTVGASWTERYLLVSVRAKDGTVHTSARVIEERSGIPALSNRVVSLMDTFMDASELEKRSMSVSASGADGKPTAFVFDSLTPAERLQTGLSEDDAPTTFYTDLTASDESGRKYYYRRALEEVHANGRVRYAQYDATGAPGDISGFFVRADLTTPYGWTPMVAGRLLTMPGRRVQDAALDQYLVNTGDYPFSARAMLYGVSQTAENAYGLPQFTMLNVVTTGPREGQETAGRWTDKLIPTTVNAEFGQLQAVKILRGRRTARDTIYAVMFFAANAETGAPGGVAAYTLNLGAIAQSGDAKNARASALVWLSREVHDPVQTIRDGFVFDVDGSLFFKEHPSLAIADNDYSVLRLSPSENGAAPASIFPNRGGLVSLRHEEAVTDETDSMRRLMSNWVLYNRVDLFRRAKGLEEVVNKLRENGRRGSRENEAYESFYDFLDTLATRETPTGHHVVLVSADQKKKYEELILARLAMNQSSAFAMEGSAARHFRLAVFDPGARGSELIREFEKLRASARTERNLVYVNLGQTLKQANIAAGGTAAAPAPAPAASGTSPAPAASETGELGGGGTAAGTAAAAAGSDGMFSEPERDRKDITPEDERLDQTYPPYSRLAVLAAEGANVPLARVATQAAAPKVAELILATPDEWRAAQAAFPDETRSGVFGSFQINRSYLTGSWTVWAPGSSQASPTTQEQARRPITREDFQVFPNLEAILNAAADPSAPREHSILIVPEELKPLVMTLIQTRWATESRQLAGPWTYRNRDLSLYKIGTTTGGQGDVLNNFEAMRGAPEGRAPVLLGTLSDVITLGRPAGGSPAQLFQLRDPSSHAGGSALEAPTGGEAVAEGAERPDEQASEGNESQTPHALWWIAAEGQRVQPEADHAWDVSAAAGRRVATILIGTERELAALANDTRFEARFLDIDKHFKRATLEAPSDQVKESLIASLLSRPEIAAIAYQFHAETAEGPAARAELISTFVSRVNQIARSTRLDPTTAFLRAFSELRRQLLDSTWRRAQVISANHFERMFSNIFNVPKNPQSLDPSDWLLRFRDPNRAAMGIARAGYPGPIELRRRMVERQWAVTKGPNRAQPMPNSIIVIGDTSTGKTELFKRTYEYAGLKEYDMEAPNDEDAGYWILHASMIEKNPVGDAAPGPRSIARIEQHILNLLAINPSAQIVFDDAHKARHPEVLEWMIGFINRLMEARQGMIQVKRLGTNAETREIPVRNIGLGVTVNPQPDQEKLRRYIGANGEKANDIYAHLVAAFNLFPTLTVEGSVFARFADRIDLAAFPAAARVPAVVMNLRGATAAEYQSDQRLRLFFPEVLSDLTTYFSGAHARELLGNVTQSLSDLPRDVVQAPIYIRSLTTRAPVFVDDGRLENELDAEQQQEDVITRGRERRLRNRDVHDYLTAQTELIAVRRDSPDTLVDLIGYMINGFRVHVYNGLVMGAQKDEWLTDDLTYRTRLFPQLVAAGLHNIEAIPFVPLSRVNLRPDQLGDLNSTQSELVMRRVQELSFSDRDMFPIEFPLVNPSRVSLREFLSESHAVPRQRTRADLMGETTMQIAAFLEDAFEAYFRVHFRQNVPTADAYIQGLGQEDPTAIFKAMGERMAEIYRRFTYEVRAAELLEAGRADSEQMPIRNYDAARLFLMTVDRAITQMPWGLAGNFMYGVVDRATANRALSGRSEFQIMLFESMISPLSPVTPDVVRQTAQASGAFDYIDMARGPTDFRSFHVRCDAIVRGFPQ